MKLKLITILIAGILFVGCGSGIVKDPVVEQPIYNSDYKEIYDHAIVLKELEKELEKSGVKLEEYGSASESSFGEYYVLVDKMSVNILTKINPKEAGEEIIQSILLYPTDAKGTDINQTPFFNSILMLMGEENLNEWLEPLEEEYRASNKKEVSENANEITGITIAGRTYISFLGDASHSYKNLRIVFGSWEDISEELKGVARELENQGLFTTDYTNGFKGNAIHLASLGYHLIDNGEHRYKENPAESLGDAEKLVAYKVMYDPDRNFNYRVQLYGFMTLDLADGVKVEDMLGIDTISRVMDMSWDDFAQVTKSINQEIAQAKKLGSQAQFKSDYSAEGKAAGYQYELYAEPYGEFYKFTVLLEKI